MVGSHYGEGAGRFGMMALVCLVWEKMSQSLVVFFKVFFDAFFGLKASSGRFFFFFFSFFVSLVLSFFVIQ